MSTGGARRPASASAFVALLALALTLLGGGAARAELKWQPGDPSAPAPAYVPPGAQLGPAPEAETERPITRRWWFWTAVGALVVTTVVVIAVASKDPAPPGSTLGNMDAFMGK